MRNILRFLLLLTVNVDIVILLRFGFKLLRFVVAVIVAVASVLMQMMSSSESSMASLAFERFLTVVYHYVSLQLIRVAETIIAMPAKVRTLARVYSHVTTEIRDLDESPLAEFAAVRFLACMKSHVRFQMMVPCKSAKIQRFKLSINFIKSNSKKILYVTCDFFFSQINFIYNSIFSKKLFSLYIAIKKNKTCD